MSINYHLGVSVKRYCHLRAFCKVLALGIYNSDWTPLLGNNGSTPPPASSSTKIPMYIENNVFWIVLLSNEQHNNVPLKVIGRVKRYLLKLIKLTCAGAKETKIAQAFLCSVYRQSHLRLSITFNGSCLTFTSLLEEKVYPFINIWKM